MTNQECILLLEQNRQLDHEQWVQLFRSYTPEDLQFAMNRARSVADCHFGKRIYFRGIVEFTNICKNNCYYCGIRCGNSEISRYRLTEADILACCAEGYAGGFRTFVLQGGEDRWFTDERLVPIVEHICNQFPDCVVTLSVGERSRDSYQRLYDAGARRYLLRHETITPEHYAALHPADLSIQNRVQCLQELKAIGYQVGCGIMVGTPFQTPEDLARDMEFMGQFQPHMAGIGPFLPHSQTPFQHEKPGSVELTLLCLSLTRLLLPKVLLPATTALGTAESDGRKMGILAGCNVVMPNLSPTTVRKKYMLYDHKAGSDMTAAQNVALLKRQMEEIGYHVVTSIGNHPDKGESNVW